MSGNEAAVRIDRRSLVDHCSSRFLLEKLPLGRTEHHWDPYIRHGYGKERKGYGSVCVDQMLARGEGKTRPFDTKFCMFLFFFKNVFSISFVFLKVFLTLTGLPKLRYVKITACFPARLGMEGNPPNHWLCLDEKMIE